MTLSNNSPDEQALVQEIKNVQKLNPHFGKRRIHDSLHKIHPTWSLSEKRVIKIMIKYNLAKVLETSPAAMTGGTSTGKMEFDTKAMISNGKNHGNNQVEDLVSTASEKDTLSEEEELSENQMEVLIEVKKNQEQSTAMKNDHDDIEDDTRSREKGEQDDNQMEHDLLVTETTPALPIEPSPVEDRLDLPAEDDVSVCSKETADMAVTPSLSIKPFPLEDRLVLPVEDNVSVCSKENMDMAVDDLIESTMNDLNRQRREEELLVSHQEEIVASEEVVVAPMAKNYDKKKDMPMNGTTYGTPPTTENKEPKNQSTTVDPVDQQRCTCDCAVM